MSSDTFYPAEGGHREAGERVPTGSDRSVSGEVDLIARGMRWEDCEALIKEACAQAGVAWGEDEKPQSIAINVMMRVANAAHKAGFELGKERMTEARERAAALAERPDLQPLHNLLYLAQRQTSLAAMQRVVSEARLELSKLKG